jgi:hypothetical protein
VLEVQWVYSSPDNAAYTQVSVTYIGSKNIGNKECPFTSTQGTKEIHHANIKEQQEPVS